MTPLLDRRPIVIALAGPNGAGKSTFYNAFLASAGLRFVNADVLALVTETDPYTAAALADTIRRTLVERGESFIFETVFSDPVGDKLSFLLEAQAKGYTIALFFVGISGPERSQTRVDRRVLEGGHDVPSDKLATRYPRILQNLKRALVKLPHVYVYDNDDLRHPYRFVVAVADGKLEKKGTVPEWLKALLP